MTIAEEIAQLETELTSVRDKISKVEHIKSFEEGSSSSRFATEYTPLQVLEDREYKIKVKLSTLKGYSE